MKAFVIFFALFIIVSTNIASATPIEEQIARARQAEKNNQIDTAIAILEEILTQEPNNKHTNKIYYELGMLLCKQQQYPQAVTYLNKAVQTTWEVGTLFSIATNLCNIGEFEPALAIFEQILKQHPEIHEARYNYAYTLKAAGHLDQAIDTYRAILTHNPEHAQAHLGLAFSYIMQGDFINGWHEHAWNLQNQKKR